MLGHGGFMLIFSILPPAAVRILRLATGMQQGSDSSDEAGGGGLADFDPDASGPDPQQAPGGGGGGTLSGSRDSLARARASKSAKIDASLDQLRTGAGLGGIRGILCSCVLLALYMLGPAALPLHFAVQPQAEQVLGRLRGQFGSHGAIIGYFNVKYHQWNRAPVLALAALDRVLDSVQPALGRITSSFSRRDPGAETLLAAMAIRDVSLWERIWTLAACHFSGEVVAPASRGSGPGQPALLAAYECSVRLFYESTWSRCVYSYLAAVCLACLPDPAGANAAMAYRPPTKLLDRHGPVFDTPVQWLERSTAYRQKFAGRSLAFEKFVIRRGRSLLKVLRRPAEAGGAGFFRLDAGAARPSDAPAGLSYAAICLVEVMALFGFMPGFLPLEAVARLQEQLEGPHVMLAGLLQQQPQQQPQQPPPPPPQQPQAPSTCSPDEAGTSRGHLRDDYARVSYLRTLLLLEQLRATPATGHPATVAELTVRITGLLHSVRKVLSRADTPYEFALLAAMLPAGSSSSAAGPGPGAGACPIDREVRAMAAAAAAAAAAQPAEAPSRGKVTALLQPALLVVPVYEDDYLVGVLRQAASQLHITLAQLSLDGAEPGTVGGGGGGQATAPGLLGPFHARLALDHAQRANEWAGRPAGGKAVNRDLRVVSLRDVLKSAGPMADDMGPEAAAAAGGGAACSSADGSPGPGPLAAESSPAGAPMVKKRSFLGGFLGTAIGGLSSAVASMAGVSAGKMSLHARVSVWCKWAMRDLADGVYGSVSKSLLV
ncbi:hypothetical protein H696_04311 [Fonticula alba]|uniref:Uncharacterized protein n=1 Tax=Fonticula alba TaxID=691883 RepID=A0A058Z4P0_FONAL|nr:hypothetical protein H696_04311 [Fonticula alba]KCV68893.1 hypothetical protein H696_04311 [Fonticula alba]|eukprot:XP_009496464.1 hypothetical protein H696_04311 [Fonticula alba]